MKIFAIFACVLLLSFSCSFGKRRKVMNKKANKPIFEAIQKFAKKDNANAEIFHGEDNSPLIDYSDYFQVYKMQKKDQIPSYIAAIKINVQLYGKDSSSNNYLELIYYMLTNQKFPTYPNFAKTTFYDPKISNQYFFFEFARYKYDLYLLMELMDRENLRLIEGKKSYHDHERLQLFCISIIRKVIKALYSYYNTLHRYYRPDIPKVHLNLSLDSIQFDEKFNVYLPPPIMILDDAYYSNLSSFTNEVTKILFAPETFSFERSERLQNDQTDIYAIGILTMQVLGGKADILDKTNRSIASNIATAIYQKNYSEKAKFEYNLMMMINCARFYNEKIVRIVKMLTKGDYQNRPNICETETLFDEILQLYDNDSSMMIKSIEELNSITDKKLESKS